MYHQVAEPPPGAVHVENWVTPGQFEAQLAHLSDAGYRSITLEDWTAGTALPKRPLVITFDDGYASAAETAWPLLRARGFGALNFLVANEIGGTNSWDADEVPQRLLDASDIRRLAAEGMRFGSHGWSHRRLRQLPAAALRDELIRSRELLTGLVGEPVRAIAYPYNSADDRVIAAARAAGYLYGVRGRGRINPRRTDPLALRRIKADLRTSFSAFRRKLAVERWIRW